MSRWLQAAWQALIASDKTVLTDKTQVGVGLMGDVNNPAGVKSVKSVLSAGVYLGRPALAGKRFAPDLVAQFAPCESNELLHLWRGCRT